jgi:predicted XRE-type DNA-binding protein
MSTNIFADLGFPDPEDHLAKAEIVCQITRLIKEKKLTQKQVAQLFHLSQPSVSALLNGRFRGYSLDRLLRYVNVLNHNVTIMIEPAETEHAVITVASMAHGESAGRRLKAA